MQIPAWLTIAIAALVIIFGAYRIYLATRSSDEQREERKRSGLYTMSKRGHLFVGIIYLLLGGGLIATMFGWTPFG